MKTLLAFIAIILLSGCAFSDAERLERDTEIAEKRELYALEQQACEESASSAWMCTGGSKKSQEEFPWLHCSCVDNRGALR